MSIVSKNFFHAHNILLYDLKNSTIEKKFSGHNCTIIKMVNMFDNYVCSSAFFDTIKIWNLDSENYSTLNCVLPMTSMKEPTRNEIITDMLFLRNKMVIISASDSGIYEHNIISSHSNDKYI